MAQDDARARRWTLIAMILASGIVFLDGSVVNVALPAIDRNLGAGLTGLQWIVNGYTLTLSAFLILGGSLGDHYGRSRIMLLGLVGFGVASVACGLAPQTGGLIGARLVQGLAGALVVPGSLAILTAVYGDEEERGRVIGAWSGASGITTVLGPFLGGWLTDALFWRWIFFINVPFIAVAAWLIWRHVPETRDPHAPRRLDWPGALLTIAGLGGVAYGLTEGPALGWRAPLVIGSLVGGVAALIVFVIVEARSAAPMLPLRLFRSRVFAGTNLATLGIYAALSGASFFLTIYLQNTLGYSALAAGASFFPLSLIVLALSSRFGQLAGRHGPRGFMAGGAFLAALALLLLVRVGPGVSYWTTIFPAILVLGLGLAMIVAPLTTAVMGAVPSDNAGIASAINNVASRVAGLLAIAALGVVVSLAFNATLTDRTRDLAPSSAIVAQIDVARRDPSGARPAADLDPAVAAITDAATASFHQAMIANAILAALGGLAAALTVGAGGSDRAARKSAPA
jgi:EmrB/QacA subfamily drug resistance transporter